MLVSWTLVLVGAIFPLLIQGAAVVHSSHPLELESRQGPEGLLELMRNNEKRYQRLNSIKEDVESIEENMILAETNFNESTAYYKAVWESYANRHGFPSFNSMVDNIAEITRQAGLPGADIWDEKYDKEESARIALYVSGATAALAGMGNAYLKSVYAIPLFSGPGHTWTYLQRARIYNIRRLSSVRPRGIFSMLRRNIVSVDDAKLLLKQSEQLVARAGANGADKVWKTLLGSVPSSIDSKVLALAPKLRLASRIFKFTLIADVVAGFASLIVDAQVAHDTRDQLRDAIKDTLPLRFQAKMVQLQAAVWDKFALSVSTSAGVWVAMQQQVDAGMMCYANTDVVLAEQLDLATVDMMNSFAAITNQSVFDILYAEDLRSNNGDPWLHDELSFEDLMKAVWEGEPSTTTPAAEEQATAEEVQKLETEITATLAENMAPLVAGLVNATNVRYIELKNNKGALWRLSGPFWSFQEGSGLGNENPKPIRHRFEEVANRTSSKVILDLRASNGNVTVDQTKKLEIDMVAGTIKFNGTTTDIEKTLNSNLVPGNGWTAAFAYIQPTDGVEFEKVFDCNRKDGWKAAWTPAWGGGHVESVMEQSRDNAVMFASAQLKSGALKASPRITLFTNNNTVRIQEADEGIDTVYNLVPGTLVPRATLE